MNARANWVDYGKGIGIILVVYAHLSSSAYHAGIEIPQRFFNLSDSIIYAFHMPFFFFLSGLFVENSFRKRGAKGYITDKFTRIFYPYIVWSVIQLSVEILFSGQTQKGASISDLLAIAYRPWGQFWFLYALLLMHFLYASLRPFGKYALPLLSLVSVLLFFVPISTEIFALSRFHSHLLFFTGGIVFSEKMKKHKHSLQLGLLAAAALAGSGYFIFKNLLPPMRLADNFHPFYLLYLSILGIAAFTLLSQYLAQKNIARFLQTLGAYSLQIYLVHMLAGTGIRMALEIFGVHNWIAHILIGVPFAIIAPVILQKISDKLDFPYLFGIKSSEKITSQQEGL